MRGTVAVAVIAMVVLAGCVSMTGGPNAGSTTASGGTARTTAGGTARAGAGTGQAPPDPAHDVLGWEDGIWYNESLNVTTANGLNHTELQEVVARSMARVERIRGLEFESQVPVKVVPRDEFSIPNRGGDHPARRTFDNAKYEALFMVNESTNALAVQHHNSGSAIGGFYSPSDKRIVVVSNNASTPHLDELTLGHELTHALQDQHFDLSRYNESTREQQDSIDGLVEGDANYVQYLYKQRCENAWNGTCLGITEHEQASAGSGGGLANIGPYLIKYQPYSDGPAFLKYVREHGGWDRVNSLYRNPPASTEQVIHPALYGQDKPQQVTIADRSTDAWNRLDVPSRVNYGELGEAGMFSMLVYPGIASRGNQSVIPPQSFFTRGPSRGTSLDPYNYSAPATAGWDGDKLVVYTDDAAPPNETGYVWKSAWDSTKDAKQFVRAYRKLLEIHGAHPVDGREHAWVVPDDSGFADAFSVRRRGDRVVIVNAPTVDQLSGVHARANASA